MDWFTGALLSGIVAFVFSNFDDILFLMMWFGQTVEVKARYKNKNGNDTDINQEDIGFLVDTVTAPDSANFSRRHVVFGQVIGFTILVIVSTIGFLVGSFINHSYVGLLGFFPLLIGIWKLYQIIREKSSFCNNQEDPTIINVVQVTETEESVIHPVVNEQHQRIAPIESKQEANVNLVSPAILVINIVTEGKTANVTVMIDVTTEEKAYLNSKSVPSDISTKEEAFSNPITSVTMVDAASDETAISNPIISDPSESKATPNSVVSIPVIEVINPHKSTSWLQRAFDIGLACFILMANRNTWKVASITMANGSDNLGIYIPLFATSTTSQIIVILVVFFIFVAIWLALSYSLLYFPPLAKAITTYGEYIVPFALIGLGIYIFYESNVLSILN